MTKTYSAINWNAPTNQFFDTIYRKQAELFWLPEEIPVSDDKSVWATLDEKTKVAYKRILAGLTLLDTEQTAGIVKVADKADNLFITSVLTLFAGFETIHARSYSTIFQTLCTTDEIDELFEWVENTKELQQKVHQIVSRYQSIQDDYGLFRSYMGALALEGICFYSGFFLPLYLSGQGKMVNSGEIISLIMRDEKLHTTFVGHCAKELLEGFEADVKEQLIEETNQFFKAIVDAEMDYAKVIYDDLGLTEEVRKYVEFNCNYALACVGFEPAFDTKEDDVNAIVMNGYSIETKNHDFFSTKGNGYAKAKVEVLTDEDFDEAVPFTIV
jgi:ribonucleoside-diphosphate reductase beta chain